MEYRRYLFTFLDILGFSKIVESDDAKKVGRLLTLLKRAVEPGEEYASMMEMSFMTFSDCTVRAIPIDSKENKRDPAGILWHELIELVHAQYAILFHGYCVRGGMTIGDAFIDGQTVFGPAMVKAYILESEFAIYPRIVIDPLVFNEFENNPLLRAHDKPQEAEYLRKLVTRDSDGLYFVDYLRAMMDEMDDEGDEVTFFGQHRDFIIENSRSFKGLNKIAAKYLWMANYHNRLMNELGDDFFEHYGESRDDYLITNEDLPLQYDL